MLLYKNVCFEKILKKKGYFKYYKNCDFQKFWHPVSQKQGFSGKKFEFFLGLGELGKKATGK